MFEKPPPLDEGKRSRMSVDQEAIGIGLKKYFQTIAVGPPTKRLRELLRQLEEKQKSLGR
jgi:hypothetical protein